METVKQRCLAAAQFYLPLWYAGPISDVAAGRKCLRRGTSALSNGSSLTLSKSATDLLGQSSSSATAVGFTGPVQKKHLKSNLWFDLLL
jgi:hypothetical protein